MELFKVLRSFCTYSLMIEGHRSFTLSAQRCSQRSQKQLCGLCASSMLCVNGNVGSLNIKMISYSRLGH